LNLKKLIAIIAVVGVVIAGIVTLYIYNKAFTANTVFNQNEVFVYIPTNSTYQQAKEIVAPLLKDIEKFDFVAQKRNYNTTVKAGKFLLKKDMTSFDIVRALKSNVPVKLAFNNQETLEKLAERITTQVEPKKEELLSAFLNPEFLAVNGFNEETILAMFIPNTYEFYWDTSAQKIAEKMASEYKKFWNDERMAKAKDKNLTPVQVAVLAAIVHKETAKVDERPRVAGVYLNRLAQNMPLQADPTVIYAMKKNSNDFEQVIKRVYSKDTQGTISPYNTYINLGLPPGPIAMPDISAIDAVLNAEKHDYVYFCASVERMGYHDFASNYADHQVNARKYAEWVNKLGINR
jgi:UPF0755 protein